MERVWTMTRHLCRTDKCLNEVNIEGQRCSDCDISQRSDETDLQRTLRKFNTKHSSRSKRTMTH